MFTLVTGLAKGLRCRQALSTCPPRQPGPGTRRAELAGSAPHVPSIPSIPPPRLSESQPCHGKEPVVLPLPTPDFQTPACSSA